MNGAAFLALQKRFPGVELESSVQGHVYMRTFQGGIDEYLNLASPTAEDDRWAGVCYFHLLDDMRAVELFYRSIARGNEAARINLAHSLAYIERSEDIPDELDSIDFDSLKPYDKVLLLRIKSMHAESNSDLTTAFANVARAWKLASMEPAAAPIRADILSQLAIVESRIGKGIDALNHIEEAKRLVPESAKLGLTIIGLNLRLELGQTATALEGLAKLRKETDLPDAARASALVVEGMALWIQGGTERAIQVFGEAAAQAYEQRLSFEEFSSHVGLATLYGSKSNYKLAALHLSKAESLVADRSDELLFRHREIIHRYRTGDYTANTAVMEMEALVDELSDIGAHYDAGRVRLHLANILWQLGSSKAELELEKLSDQVKDSRNPGFLLREWVLTPELKEYVAGRFPLLVEGIHVVSISTVERVTVAYRAKPVQFTSPRASALIAYLLDSGQAYLEDILAAVFSGMPSRDARHEYSLLRAELPRMIPDFSVRLNSRTGMHKLVAASLVDWDFQAIREGTADPGTGEFLPGLNSPWISLMRAELEAIRSQAKAAREAAVRKL